MAGRSTFGNARQLPSKRWQASYWHEGVRHAAANPFPSNADADAYLAKALTTIRGGEWIDPSAGKILFQEYADKWRAIQLHRVSTEDDLF